MHFKKLSAQPFTVLELAQLIASEFANFAACAARYRRQSTAPIGMMVLLGGLIGFWPAFLALVLYSKGTTGSATEGWRRHRRLPPVGVAAAPGTVPTQGSRRADRGDGSVAHERVDLCEELVRLTAAIDVLPAEQRIAVELKHLHGCTVEQITRQMGKTHEAVGGLLRRGMRTLRDNLTAGGTQ
jgi:hypothetical protein